MIRDGERENVAATDLVPGDIIVIEEGDTIPADARVLQSTALHAAEAALTGESLPVAKDISPLPADTMLGDRHNMVFSGTAATYGRGKAVVTATGMQTEIGRIAGMLEDAPAQSTPLQQELDKVGKRLGIVVVAIAVAMIVTIIVVEEIRGLAALFDVLILGVALAVAAVPEGLPAVVTAVLALGVQRMARRNAIVRHLAAVETLGSASVIASDKTGTLTRNEMTVRALITASGRVDFEGVGYSPVGAVRRADGGEIDGPLRGEVNRALAAADRANNAVLQERDGRCTVQGDPTEAALIVAARKAGMEAEVLDARFERVGEVPFSSERKLMSTVHTDAKREEMLLAFTKGAPDVLLARCTQEQVGEERRPLTPERRDAIRAANEGLAKEALRTLGVALRLLPKDTFTHDAVDEDIEHDLVFLGLIGMIDPPRAEAADAVRRAKAAGIRPLMITGDHPVTASVIAAELGIATDGRVITGAEIQSMSDDCARGGRGEDLGVRPREPRSQTANRDGTATARQHRGDDRRWRQRRTCPAYRGHRRRDGHHGHGRVQGGRRHRARGRQLRVDRGGGRGGPRDLREHPQVPALLAVVEHRRGPDDVLRRRARRRHRPRAAGGWSSRAAAARDAGPMGQPRYGRPAGACARRRSTRHRRDAASARGRTAKAS